MHGNTSVSFAGMWRECHWRGSGCSWHLPHWGAWPSFCQGPGACLFQVWLQSTAGTYNQVRSSVSPCLQEPRDEAGLPRNLGKGQILAGVVEQLQGTERSSGGLASCMALVQRRANRSGKQVGGRGMEGNIRFWTRGLWSLRSAYRTGCELPEAKVGLEEEES
jgi:hypothetical protein